jgi:hypothetical protein
MTNKKKFLQRFSKDYNLPINVFDEEMFEYYIELYKDFFPINEYESAINDIETNFDGNVELWLDHYAKIRDNIIETVMSSDEYKHFNEINLTTYKINPICGERSCYTEETDGKYFISIDLKKANFQALKYMNVLDDESYEKFIKRFGGDDYMVNSKYLRQVIFGKMNPSRQITIEKYIMSLVYDAVCNKLKHSGFEIYSMNSDELVFYETEKAINHRAMNSYNDFKCSMKNLLNEIKAIIDKYLGFETTIEYFTIDRLRIVNSNGNKVDAYVKENYITGESKLKKASTTFFPQIYKLWHMLPINEKDKVFFFENQLATFNESLMLEE